MFIRKRKTAAGGVSYSLLESVRTPDGPRHIVVACLGCCPTVAEALAAEMIRGESNLTTLAPWQLSRPGSQETRQLRARQTRIEKQIRVLIDALAAVGGSQAEVEKHLPIFRDQESKWRREHAINQLTPEAREATDQWLQAIKDRLAGIVTLDADAPARAGIPQRRARTQRKPQ